ncbi:MAG: NAD(P)H-dependent oxidoreductase [Polyangiales bacterium]
MRFLAFSGSLRSESSNTRLLQAVALLAPDGIVVDLYDGIATLPYFVPDVDDAHGAPEVRDLRAQVEAADAVLICCPEYAGAIPGAFKNALDWLVGCTAMYEKPTAVLNASPSSVHVHASLRIVLGFLSARLVEEASLALPLRGCKLGAQELARDPRVSAPLVAALASLARAAAR